MKKIFFLSVIISIIFFSSCKKEIIEPVETIRQIHKQQVELKEIEDGSSLLMIASCQTEGSIDEVIFSVHGMFSGTVYLTEESDGFWVDTLHFENDGVSSQFTGIFTPVYDNKEHKDESVEFYGKYTWPTTTQIELGEATHVPTKTGGTSTIEISNVEENTIAEVIARKVDGDTLGVYAINIAPSQREFEVTVNFTDYPIFNTEIQLIVKVEDLTKAYEPYTTLEEESCGLSLEGNYTEGATEVNITISGNDRPSSLTFKAYNGSTLLNAYGGTMTENEETKTFNFPIESGQGVAINYVVTSEQHPLCILDGFSYITPVNPDPVTTISVSGPSPGTLKPSGGTIFGSYSNENFPSGESSTLMIQTPSEGIFLVDPVSGDLSKDIEVELIGEMGTFTYDFVSDRDENDAVFLYDCDYFESQPANTYVTTLTQTYELNGSVNVVQVDSLQTTTVQLMSADLNTNYTGTVSQQITLKIKNTLEEYSPWEYLSLLTINGTNFPVGNQSDWGNTDAEGFYTFTVNVTYEINISNIDFVTVGYRSKAFTKGSGDSFEMKVSVEVNFLDNTNDENFQPWSSTLSVDIE